MSLDMAGIRLAFGSSAVKYLLIVCAVVGAVTCTARHGQRQHRAVRQHYPMLLALNGGLAVCLTALLGYQLSYAARRNSRRAYSARSSRCAWCCCSRWSRCCPACWYRRVGAVP